MFRIAKSVKQCIRHFGTHPNFVVEPLRNRTLVCVSGEDAKPFLQGLITNDLNRLKNISNLFAMFLNNKGRVLYDTIIYQIEPNVYLLEADTNSVSFLQKHLQLFRIRKRVDISRYEQYSIWALFNPTTDERIDTGNQNFFTKNVDSKLLFFFRDPRLDLLGFRVLVGDDCESGLTDLYKETDQTIYKLYRYRLGVGEGPEELPTGNCFPLEANGDYLNGISFSKGCYIGQELTARTHHSGVVRKRYMPLLFDQWVSVKKDEIVYAADKNVGKVRGFGCGMGIGLLRIAPALEADYLTIEGGNVQTLRPKWWPSSETVDTKQSTAK